MKWINHSRTTAFYTRINVKYLQQLTFEVFNGSLILQQEVSHLTYSPSNRVVDVTWLTCYWLKTNKTVLLPSVVQWSRIIEQTISRPCHTTLDSTHRFQWILYKCLSICLIVLTAVCDIGHCRIALIEMKHNSCTRLQIMMLQIYWPWINKHYYNVNERSILRSVRTSL